MKRHSISIRFSSGAYEGKYLTIKPRLTHWAICSTNSRDLCTGALSRKTYVRLSNCWLNCSKHSTITGVSIFLQLCRALAHCSVSENQAHSPVDHDSTLAQQSLHLSVAMHMGHRGLSKNQQHQNTIHHIPQCLHAAVAD